MPAFPTQLAIAHGHTQCALRLLALCPCDLERALTVAVRSRNSVMVHALLDRGARADAVDGHGRSAYRLAVEQQCLKLADALERRGAPLEPPAAGGPRALAIHEHFVARRECERAGAHMQRLDALCLKIVPLYKERVFVHARDAKNSDVAKLLALNAIQLSYGAEIELTEVREEWRKAVVKYKETIGSLASYRMAEGTRMGTHGIPNGQMG